MREAESSRLAPSAAALLRFGGDVILLVRDLMLDPRVARADKLVAGLGFAYVLSPVDLLPDAIVFLGQLDDLSVALFALRRLLARAGYEVVYELWRGSDEGLALVLALAGVQDATEDNVTRSKATT